MKKVSVGDTGSFIAHTTGQGMRRSERTIRLAKTFALISLFLLPQLTIAAETTLTGFTYRDGVLSVSSDQTLAIPTLQIRQGNTGSTPTQLVILKFPAAVGNFSYLQKLADKAVIGRPELRRLWVTPATGNPQAPGVEFIVEIKGKPSDLTALQPLWNTRSGHWELALKPSSVQPLPALAPIALSSASGSVNGVHAAGPVSSKLKGRVVQTKKIAHHFWNALSAKAVQFYNRPPAQPFQRKMEEVGQGQQASRISADDSALAPESRESILAGTQPEAYPSLPAVAENAPAFTPPETTVYTAHPAEAMPTLATSTHPTSSASPPSHPIAASSPVKNTPSNADIVTAHLYPWRDVSTAPLVAISPPSPPPSSLITAESTMIQNPASNRLVTISVPVTPAKPGPVVSKPLEMATPNAVAVVTTSPTQKEPIPPVSAPAAAAVVPVHPLVMTIPEKTIVSKSTSQAPAVSQSVSAAIVSTPDPALLARLSAIETELARQKAENAQLRAAMQASAAAQKLAAALPAQKVVAPAMPLPLDDSLAMMVLTEDRHPRPMTQTPQVHVKSKSPVTEAQPLLVNMPLPVAVNFQKALAPIHVELAAVPVKPEVLTASVPNVPEKSMPESYVVPPSAMADTRSSGTRGQAAPVLETGASSVSAASSVQESAATAPVLIAMGPSNVATHQNFSVPPDSEKPENAVVPAEPSSPVAQKMSAPKTGASSKPPAAPETAVEKMLKSALIARTDDERSYLKLATYYMQEKAWPQAEKALLVLLNVKPTSSQGYFSLALVYAAEHRPIEAQVTLDTYKRLNPTDTVSLRLAQDAIHMSRKASTATTATP